MRVLVLNAGSSTVKAALADADAGGATVVERRTFESEGAPVGDTFDRALDAFGGERIDAVGHRVVHGGTRFDGPVRIDDDVERAIESLVPLAPSHNPAALAGIRAAKRKLSGVPMVAVFDTAFHHRRSEESRRYALPDELARTLGLWRYGFHGIAHASLVDGVAALEGVAATDVDAVTLQLGRGCSACAVRRGVSVETSMGFTPLEGLPMGTRSGDVDPGLVLYLLRQGRSLDDVQDLLERRSGLLGVGGFADMRELLQARERGDRRAATAVSLFVRRIAMTVGAYLTLLGGRGAIVFGGGIGENAADIRRAVALALEAWNVAIDGARERERPPVRISPPGARAVYVIPTDEERLIARAVATLLA